MVIKRDTAAAASGVTTPPPGTDSGGRREDADKATEDDNDGVHTDNDLDLDGGSSSGSTVSEDKDGFSKDISIVYNDIRPCGCDSIRTSTINGKPLDATFLNLDSSLLHKLHEMGEDDITGPPGVNDLKQYLVRREEIGKSVP
jgi:hypothetical protein